MKRFLKKILDSKFSRDTIWLIGAQIILMLSSLLINLFIGRFYDVGILGIFNQSLSFYMVFVTLLGLGLNTALIKKMAEENRPESNKRKLFTATLFTTLLTSTVLTVLLFILVKYNPNLFSSTLLAEFLEIMLLAVPFFCLNRNFSSYFSGKRIQREFAIQRIIRWIMILTIVFIGIYAEWLVESMMYAFVITEATLFIYNCFILIGIFDFSFTREHVMESVSFGIQCYVSGIISIFNTHLDIILLGYLLTKEDIGVYSFVVFCTRTLYVFPGIIMQNISPIISNLWEQGKVEELKKKIQSVRKINIIALSVQVVLLLIGYNLLILILKQEFSGSFGYFLIALPGVFIFALISWSGGMLVMAGKPKENILRSLLVIVFSIISFVVFGNLFGLLGACIAILVNGILSFLIMKSFILRILGIKII